MLSVVIPVYNEAPGLTTLFGELDDVARRHGYDLEIIFVDDGSTDESWKVITQLAEGDARVRGIRFRRNFGKAAALSAGFESARGDLIITMDADLQDNPHEIPGLLDEIESGFDVVSGWKKVRHDPWHKVGPSRLFNWLVSKSTGVSLHDHNCGLKCYRQAVIREIRIYGELHRFVPVLAAARGYRVGERVVEHRPRPYGKSKYGVNRFIKGFLDLLTVKFLTGFGQRPLHLLGTFGMLSFLLGMSCLIYLACYWVVSRVVVTIDVIHLHQRAVLYYALALLMMGGQLMSIGFLGELVIACLGRNVDTYSIAERTGVGEPTTAELNSS